MPDYVTLLGSEEVSRAGHNMQHAAESMRQSVGYLDETLARHRRFMDEWLQRFEAALSAAQGPKEGQ